MLAAKEDTSFKYSELTTEREVYEHIQWLNSNREFVTLDIETTGLDPWSDTITNVIVNGRGVNSAACIPGLYVGALNSLATKVLVFHNFKFDCRMLARAGVNLLLPGRVIRDTMLLHHLYNENSEHGLGPIVEEFYADDYKRVFWSNRETFKAADGTLRGVAKGTLSLQEEDPEAFEYACKDVIYTDLLYRDLSGLLRDQGIPDSLVDHVHRLAISLYETETQGILIDIPFCTEMGAFLKPKLAEFAQDMRKSVDGYATAIEYDLWAKKIDKLYKPGPRATAWRTLPKPVFNWNSHDQVNTLLYGMLKLPEQRKKNKKGQMVLTSEDDALARIEHLHPVVPMLRTYSEYNKIYGSFIEGTLERIHNGRIYPSFNINGTVTGRISSSDPNLQQLPSKGDWAKVRGIYIPDHGRAIITCDYSQLEVTIAAHFSQDPNLLKIVLEGASKHDITAEGLQIPRGLAKTLNFAMQYQCTSKKVAQILNCSDKEARYIWNKYWETYAGEKKVIDECKAKVDSGEPIVNPFGRRRRFPTEFAKSWHKESAYRQAYSSLIQGTGADCTHRAFYLVAEWLKATQKGRALLEVHDEILIEALLAACAESRDVLQSTMINVGKEIGLSVPLSVDCSEPLARWEK